MQRALMQYRSPQNQPLVRKALRLAGREDLIGFERDCLVVPERSRTQNAVHGAPSRSGRPAAHDSRGKKNASAESGRHAPKKRSDKWAKAKPKKK